MGNKGWVSVENIPLSSYSNAYIIYPIKRLIFKKWTDNMGGREYQYVGTITIDCYGSAVLPSDSKEHPYEIVDMDLLER